MQPDRREAFKTAGVALACAAPLLTPFTASATPPAAKEHLMTHAMPERHQRGADTLASITGGSGAAVVQGLKDIAPDFAEWIISFAYGDVMSRPGLDKRSRQIATVAALTALGTATPQLKVHLHGALNVGCSPSELVEVILQMAVYAGFPATINGLNVAREVFQARGVILERVP